MKITENDIAKEFRRQNKSVTEIKNLETLGVFTFIKMLIDHEVTPLPFIIDQMCEQFEITKDTAMAHIAMLVELDLLLVTRKSKN